MASGIKYSIHQIGCSQTRFFMACNDIATRVEKGKFEKAEAKEAYAKVTNAFYEVLSNIDSVKPFLIDGEVLKEGAEEQFLKLTSIDKQARTSFNKAMASLRGLDATLPIAIDEKSASSVHVYYDGPGDLFIRGEGAQVRMPPQNSSSLSRRMDFGETKQLSWQEGVPMRRTANHLWKAALVPDEKGIPPKYKFLVSDCVWSTGENYTPNAAKSIICVPAFEGSTSLLVPMDVGYGNKLVLVGKGEMMIEKTSMELNWEERIDFDNFGPNLWVLSFKAKENLSYKICLVQESGDIIWEKGPHRTSKGQELILTPNFGEGIGRAESMEKASANLGLHLLEQQDLIKEQSKEKYQQKKAQVEQRPLPALYKKKADDFSDDTILQVNEFVKIEEQLIDGIPFQLHYTKNNKAIIMQEVLTGCTAGASSMLIVDNGKLPKAADLLNRKAANFKKIALDIQAAGLETLLTPVASLGRSLEKLREQILKHGPAYVRVKKPNTSGHAILVDEISQDLKKVRIRDPWHGWEIIIKAEAFKEYWYNSLNQAEADDFIVQVRNGVK